MVQPPMGLSQLNQFGMGRVENHQAVSLGTVRWLSDALSAPGPITANTVNAKPWPRMCTTDISESCLLDLLRSVTYY